MSRPAPARRRVAFVTDVITPYMVAVMQALSERVELRALFCSERGTRSANWAIERDLGFDHEVIGGATIERSHPDATDFYPSPRILRAIARTRPEAVISGGFSFPTLYAATYSLARGSGLVIHSDGTSRSEQNLNPVQRAARPILLRVAGACAANSRPAAERFVELGFPRERVIDALHTTNMQPFWDASRARDTRGPDVPLRVVSVGRLIPRKGLDRFLPALATARDRGAQIELTLVGTGSEEEALRRQAAELELSVDFRGFVDQDGLPAIYAESDVFAFPTLDDPFGIVLIEAAAAGLPLVASIRGGATLDLVEDGVNGFTYAPEQAEPLVDALVRLASDRDLVRRMGHAAHETTLTRTPEAAADAYARAVEAALEERSRGVVRLLARRGERISSRR